MYFINSTEVDIVQNFVDELDNHISRAELFSVNNEVNIFNQVTMMQLIELSIMSILLFICIFATLINYAVSKLKSNSVFSIHGYSKFSIIKKSVIELSIFFLITFIISYGLLFLYSYFSGYQSFLSMISLYFVFTYVFLVFVYMIFFNIFMFVYLLLVKTTNILKGKKPYFFLQFANHASKIAFTIAILIFGHLAIDAFIEFNHRRDTTSSWEFTENIHRTYVYDVGQTSDTEIDLDITVRKLELYDHLTREMSAFIMNSRNVWFLDEGRMHYYGENPPPVELAPSGYRVTISPNFLKFNPINSLNGIDVFEQIIYDPYVLNILVPENLSSYEDEIIRLYLDYFYFSSVRIDNIYNEDLGLESNTTSIENLSINIIYVVNNQSYFSFDSHLRPEQGNNIIDPIAVLYTGSVHPHRLSGSMGGSFFFYTDAINAHDAIVPFLVDSGLTNVIRSTSSVFDENARVIVELREDIVKALILVSF